MTNSTVFAYPIDSVDFPRPMPAAPTRRRSAGPAFQTARRGLKHTCRCSCWTFLSLHQDPTCRRDGGDVLTICDPVFVRRRDVAFECFCKRSDLIDWRDGFSVHLQHSGHEVCACRQTIGVRCATPFAHFCTMQSAAGVPRFLLWCCRGRVRTAGVATTTNSKYNQQ